MVAYIITRYRGEREVISNRITKRKDFAARCLVNETRDMIWANSLADTRVGHSVHHGATTLAREVASGQLRRYFDEYPSRLAQLYSFAMCSSERDSDRVSIAIVRDDISEGNAERVYHEAQ